MSDEYEKLKKIWYDKLKASRFHDIEMNHKKPFLKGGASNRKFTNTEANQARQEYGIMIYQFLHSHKFESELHKTIWAYYTEGISIRKTAELLKEAGIGKYYKRSNKKKPLSTYTINQVLLHYRELMKKGV